MRSYQRVASRRHAVARVASSGLRRTSAHTHIKGPCWDEFHKAETCRRSALARGGECHSWRGPAWLLCVCMLSRPPGEELTEEISEKIETFVVIKDDRNFLTSYHSLSLRRDVGHDI